MFSEYREKIAELRASNRNFSRLFDQHATLDQEIESLQSRRTPSLHTHIEQLKKQKLLIKEQLYGMLQGEPGGAAA